MEPPSRPERRLALGLLGVGIALCVASLAWAPRAAEIDRWEPFHDPVPRLLSARGPAVARYDAANDTTIASFLCGHWHCQDAVLIEGDARAAVAQDRVALATVTRAEGTAPLEPPLPLGEPFQNVTRVTNARFVVRPFWPAFSMAPLALLTLGAAAGAWLEGARGARIVGAAVAGGAATGSLLATFPGDAIVFAYLLLALGLALALVAITVQKWRKARPATAAFALATVALFLWARPWFPSMPSL